MKFVAVTTPVTFTPVAVTMPLVGSIVIAVPTLTALLKVENPATFTSSSSVCPSTSKLPLASIAPVNVLTPVTEKSLATLTFLVVVIPVSLS